LSLRQHSSQAGFTLVEVAVALVIVGIGLTLCLQSLQTAKMQAAHTRNLKLARELGVMTLGQIESGLYQEDIQNGFTASYAQEGYPDFYFELLLGEESFENEEINYSSDGYHDSFESRRQRRLDEAQENGEDEEDIEEPFEKVKIRVMFPRINEYRNYLDIESWFVWEQVYGPDEEEEESAADRTGDA
jgi:prepilin-type N-terminal cleavage/methylation domain-containing protein